MSRLFEKFKRDVWGIFLFTMATFLTLSLISFNPMDPSFNSIGSHQKATNFCGLVGSFLADALYQVFGLGAWILVLSLVRLGWLQFRGQSGVNNLRLVWASLLLMNTCTLLAIYFPEQTLYHNQITYGGLLGLGSGRFLVKAFNVGGVQVMLWGLSLILLVFYSEKTLIELSKIPGLLFKKAKSLLPSLPKNRKKLSLFKKEDIFIPETKSAKSDKGFFPLVENAKATEEEEDISAPVVEVKKAEPVIESVGRRKVVLKAKVQTRIENWELPKISFLEDPPASRVRVDEREIKRKAELLKEKMSHFSVTGEVVAAKPGPAVTMFEFKPDADVKLSKITELADDLSLALSSESLRIIAPIPGRDVVGIETSNAHREVVYLKDMLADEVFWKEDMRLPVALGKQASGESKIVDIRRLPHLMVAGTTGSGKSVFIVSTIIGLLFKHSPKTLRLLLVDPKQVDLAAFEKVPHLLMPIVTDSRQAVSSLKWAVREMEKRYKSMSQFGARGLEAYNENVAKLSKDQIEEHEKTNLELESTPGKKSEQYYYQPLPYIVIVIEEFADLMSVDKANVEQSVVRLAQKARACGIHLILAMQSPRKEVVTGLIKTNIPGRISFKVSSSMDSRIVLDDVGADRLLAQGDMLFRNPGGANLIRHHGPFLKDSEIQEICSFWAAQSEEPAYDDSAMRALDSAAEAEQGGGVMGEGGEDFDERYDEILSWASTMKEVSASLIQRRFQLGYPRAARIIEAFERQGVVGPAQGSKPRQVLVHNLHQLAE